MIAVEQIRDLMDKATAGLPLFLNFNLYLNRSLAGAREVSSEAKDAK